MVGIVSGNSLGLQAGSLIALGGNGAIGTANTGANGETAYVNVTTGDLVLEDVDGFLAGSGDSSFTDLRTYNSQEILAGAPAGWLEAPYKTITLGTSTSTLTRTDSDGSTVTYALISPGVYQAEFSDGSAFDTISVSGEGADATYTWTDGATGDREIYGQNGTTGSIQLQSSIDTEGDTLTYSYDDGFLHSVSNADPSADGDIFTYTYYHTGVSAGLLESVSITPDSRDTAAASGSTTVNYAYTASGQLQDVTVTTLWPSGDTSSYATSYQYNSHGLISQISQGGSPNQDGTQTGAGSTVNFYYTANSAGLNQVTKVVDGDGNTTIFDYDSTPNTTTVTGPSGLKTVYTYDTASSSSNPTGAGTDMIAQIATQAAGDTGPVTQAAYAYNTAGELLSIADNAGNVTTMTYYADGNLETRTDPNGDETSWTYNEFNQVVSQSVFTAATSGSGGGDTSKNTAGSAPVSADGLPQKALSGTSTGGDTFTYDLGYGAVSISENSTGNGPNVLSFGAGITAASVSVSISGSNLILWLNATDQVTIINGYTQATSGWGVQQVKFADGTVWSTAQLKVLAQTAGANNTALSGTPSGNDTFTYNAGTGPVAINDTSGSATLVFGAGITASSILASASGNDLILSVAGSADSVTIVNGNFYTDRGWGIQKVVFADGTVWNAAQLKAVAETASASNSYIHGTEGGNDTFTYNAGTGPVAINDTSGSATLVFGTGITASSILASASGNDLILSVAGSADSVTIVNGNFYTDRGWGIQKVVFADGTVWNAAQLKTVAETASASNTYIHGTEGGNDTFTYNAGTGAVAIYESAGGTNALSFGAGITASSVTVYNSGSTMVLVLSATDQISLINAATSSGWGVQQVVFADGTVWTKTQLQQMAAAYVPPQVTTLTLSTGTDVADTGGSYDIVQGNGADDTFLYNQGYGALSISQRGASGNATGVLQLGTGLTLANLSVSAPGADTLVLSFGNGDRVTLLHGMSNNDGSGNHGWGVQTVQFANGSTLSLAQLRALADTAYSGNTTLYGSNMADGWGATYNGSDTFTYAAGDGAVTIDEEKSSGTSMLQLGTGLTLAGLSVTSPGADNLVLSFGNGDQITLLHGMSNNDGSGDHGWGVQTVQFANGSTLSLAQLRALADTAYSGNTTLYGSNMADGWGATYNGSDTFTYAAGDGAVTIDEEKSSGTSVLQLGAGITLADLSITSPGGDNLVLRLSATDTITLLHGMSNNDGSGDHGWGVQTVQFANGSTLSLAQLRALADTAYSGNTTLYGSNMADGWGATYNGSDTFTYAAGDGAVTIDEEKYSGTSVLQLGAGITLADLSITSPGGDNLMLRLSATDTITILHGMSNNDGSGDHGWGVQTVQFANGGTLSLAQLQALADTAYSGNTTLYGSNMADGWGATYNGSDTFTYAAGDGAVTIDEEKYSGTSVLQLGAGITLADLSITSPGGDNLVLRLSATDTITLLHGMSNNDGSGDHGWGVQTVQFANGSTLSLAQLQTMAETGAAGNRTLYGTNMAAGWGATYNGNDTFTYAAGTGAVTIDEQKNSGTSLLQLGAGLTRGALSVFASGSNLILSFGPTDQITLLNGKSGGGWGVQQVEFADGSSMSLAQLQAIATAGSAGSGGTLSAPATGTEIFESDGVYGNVQGDGASDTFGYNKGDGAVTISQHAAAGTDSVLQVGAGLSADAMVVTSSGNDLILTFDNIDAVTLTNAYNESGQGWGVQSVQFADGTTKSLSITQLQQLARTAGQQKSTLYGSTAGNDTFAYNLGDGAVTINESSASNGQANILQFGVGIVPADVVVTSSGNDLVLSLGNGDQITITNGYHYAAQGWGIQQVDFTSGGTNIVWPVAEMQAMARGANAQGAPLASDASSGVQTTRYIYSDPTTPGQRPQLAFTISPQGEVTQYLYNSRGQLSATILYPGATDLVSAASSNQAAMNQWVAAQQGQQVQETDYCYDFRGLLATSTTYDSVTSAADPTDNLKAGASAKLYLYNDRGELLQTVTPSTHETTSYVYDELGRVLQTTVTDTGPGALATRTTTTTYNDSTLTATTTLPSGLVTTAQYDADGLLVETQDAPAVGSSGGANTTTESYNVDGQIVKSVDANGVASWAFYDALGRKIGTVDGAGEVTQYFYNADNQLTETIASAVPLDAGTLASLEALATGTQFDTESWSTIVQALQPQPQDEYSWNFYDASGRLTGQVTSTDTDNQGSVAETVYDAASRVTSTTQFATTIDTAQLIANHGIGVTLAFAGAGGTTSTGAIAVAQSALDRTTRNIYDAGGLLIGTIDALGNLIEYQYNGAGQLFETIQYVNAIGSYDPDALDQSAFNIAVGRARLAGDVSSLRPVGSPTIETYTLYDSTGRVVGEVDGDGYLTETAYDADGQVQQTIRYTDPVTAAVTSSTTLESVRQSLASTDGETTTYGRDDYGQVEEEVDAAGDETLYQYNTTGQVTQVVTGDASRQTTVDTVYDAQGRAIYIFTSAGDGTAYDVVGLSYDADGNLVARRVFATQIPAAEATTLSEAVGVQGNLDHSLDAPGDETTRYVYDADGRQLYVIDPTGVVTGSSYDGIGRLTSTTVFAIPIALDGVSDDLQPGDVQTALATAHDNTTTNYTSVYLYDAAGNRIYTVDADGNVTRQQYDAFGNVTAVMRYATPIPTATVGNGGTFLGDEELAYVIFNDQSKISLPPSGPSEITRFVYDANGQEVYAIDPTGAVTGSSYDGVGRLTSRTVFGAPIDPASLSDAPTQAEVYAALQQAGDAPSAAGAPATAINASIVDIYDADGRVTYSVDAGGYATHWQYDAYGNVTSETRYAVSLAAAAAATSESLGLREIGYVLGNDPTGLVDLVAASPDSDQTTRYVYDADNRLRFTLSSAGDGTKLSVAELRYDAQGAVIERIAYAGFIDAPTAEDPTALDSVQGVQNALDALAADPAATAGSLNQTTLTVYDDAGNAIDILSSTGSDGKYALVTQSFDALGNLKARIAYATPVTVLPDPVFLESPVLLAALVPASTVADQQSYTIYDQDNRAIWTADGYGDVTQQFYDVEGNAVRTVQYAARLIDPGSGLPDPATLLAGNRPPIGTADRITDRAYDADGNLVYTVDALGDVSKTIYDAYGNAVQQIDFAATLAPPSLATQPATLGDLDQATASHLADAANRMSFGVYDADNRQIYAIAADGAVRQTSYDSQGRVIATTAYATEIAVTPGRGPFEAGDTSLPPDQTNPANRTTLYGYDALGNLTYTVDPAGYVTQQQYDAFGHAVTTTRYAQPITVTGGLWLFQTTYIQSTQSSAIAYYLVATPGLDETTTATYDTAGRLVADTDAMGNAESYSYDALGNKLSFTNRNGDSWHYAYDAAGLMVVELDPAVEVGSGGDLTSAPTTQDVTIGTAYGYDALGNLTSRTEAFNVAGQSRVTSYSYDALGRQIETLYPQSEVVDTVDGGALTGEAATTVAASLVSSITYDAFGDAIADQLFALDATNTSGTLPPPLSTTLKAYDQLGRVIDEVDAEGGVTAYGYDSFGDQTSLTRFSNPVDISGFVDLYLVTGDPAALTLAVSDASSAYDRTIDSSYDLMGRVVLVEQPETWVNDGTGAAGYAAKEYTGTAYDAFGEVTQSLALVRQPSTGPIAANGSWDPNDVWAATNNYYDLRGNLVATIDPQSYLTTSSYDAFGNLVSQTEYANPVAARPASLPVALPVASLQDRTTTYAYDSDNRKIVQTQVDALYTLNGVATTGNLQTWYGYDQVGNLVSTTDPLGNTTTTVYDALGRITAVISPRITDTATSTAETPETHFIRDAYGNVVEEASGSQESGDTRFTYTAYDARGNAVETSSAVGDGSFITKNMAYDLQGNLVETWQQVSGQIDYAYYAYDRLNRQVASVTPAPNTGEDDAGEIAGVVAATQYDTFGEVTKTWNEIDALGGLTYASLTALDAPLDSAGQTVTFYDYDSTGHVWRTNAKTGVVTVMFYDLQGFQTVSITSAGGADGADLLAADATPWQIDGASTGSGTGYARTDMAVDLLGRVLYQAGPWRPNADGDLYRPEIDQSFDRWGNLTSQTAPYDAEQHDGLNGQTLTTYYTYDDDNKLIEQVQSAAGATGTAAAPVLADTLYGTGGADVFDTQGQARTVIGNGGGDTFRYNAGYGSLVINEAPGNGAANLLAFGAGISETQLSVAISGDNLVLTLSPTDQITLVNAYDHAGWGVQAVSFTGGPTLDAAQLLAMAGTPSTQQLAPTSGATYDYTPSPGNVTVTTSNSAAVLNLHGVDPTQIAVSTNGTDLYLTLSTGQVITLIEGFAAANYGTRFANGAGTVNFDDGTSWTLQDLRNLADSASIGNRALYGSGSGGQTFTYGAGDGAVWIGSAAESTGNLNVVDLGAGLTASALTVSAPNGDDLVLSFSATDTLTIADGYSGANHVWGGLYGIGEVRFADGTVLSIAQLRAMAQTAGPGNSSLFAYTTPASFAYSAGDGAVSIYDVSQDSTLRLGTGIDPSQVSVTTPNGQDLVLTLSPTDIITIDAGYSGSSGPFALKFGVETVTFADAPGTSWSLTQLRAMAAANPASYGAGSTLHAAGSTTFSYVAGSGAQTLSGSAGAGLLQLDGALNPWDLGVSSDGTNLTLRFSPTDSVTIPNGMNAGSSIANLRFADGYVLSIAQLRAMATTATAANPVLHGTSNGSDSFAYDQGAGAATIQLAATNPSVATLQLNGIAALGVGVSSPNGSDLVLAFSATDSVTILGGYAALVAGRGVQSVTFADGTEWSAAHIEQLLTGAVTVSGGAASGPVQHYGYDADGQEVAAIDANGNRTSQVWNADGELAEVIHADGGVITNSYDAFGDQVQTIDAMGNVTEYGYDGLGRQITMVQGANVGALENGVLVGASAGVVVGSDDGTGTALHAGALLNIVTTFGYDQLGDRIEEQVGAALPVDAAQFTASQFIGPVTETLDGYDLRGNLITAVAADDNPADFADLGAIPTTRYAYDDQGRMDAEIDANGNSETWNYDSFGQLQSHVDLGGRLYQYSYDAAGRLTEATVAATVTADTAGVAADDQTYSYDAAGDLLQEVDQGGGQTAAGPASTETSSFAYDASGRQVWSQTVVGGATVQNQMTGYDDLGRVSAVAEYGTTGQPGAGDTAELTETFRYDLVGNKLETIALRSGEAEQDLYYAYNDMNELILADAPVYDGNPLDESNITDGAPGVAHGHIMTYDLDGNRLTDTFEGKYVEVVTSNGNGNDGGGGGGSSVTDPDPDGGDAGSDGGGDGDTIDTNGKVQAQDGPITETYSYDSLNRLATITTTEYSVDSSGLRSTPFTVTLDQRVYDAASRVTHSGPDAASADFNGPGTYQAFIKAFLGPDANSDLPGETASVYAYDDLGRLLTEKVTDLGNAGSSYTVSYAASAGDGDSDGYDKAGNALLYSVTDSTGAVTTYATTVSTEMGGGYQAVTVTTTDSKGDAPAVTTESYDGDGRLVAINENNQSLADRHIYNDASGVVLETIEGTNADADPSQANLSVLHEVVVNGSPIATYGSGVDPNDPTLPVGSGGGVPQPNIIEEDDYDLAYAPVTNDYPAPSVGVYQVQSGDTLQSIALAAYGDASLWYLIAEANGLASDQDLHVGAALTIPTVVGDIHDNTGTVAPYNPAKIIGPTTPSLPVPAAPVAGGQGCGIIAEIAVLIVTIVVTYFTAGATSSLLEAEFGADFATSTAGLAIAGAAGAAVGSAVGQAVGIGLGIQKDFNWGQVGLAALGGAIGGAVNGIQAPDAPDDVIKAGGMDLAGLSGTPRAIVGAVLVNAVTQGVGVAVGLQKSFSWQQVAAAGVGAGIGSQLTPDSPTFTERLIGGTIGGLAGAGTAAALGVRSGNLGNVAVDAFGNALGSSLAYNDWSGGNSDASAQAPLPEQPDAISITQLDLEQQASNIGLPQSGVDAALAEGVSASEIGDKLSQATTALGPIRGYLDPNGNVIQYNAQVNDGVYRGENIQAQQAFAQTEVTASVLKGAGAGGGAAAIGVIANPEVWVPLALTAAGVGVAAGGTYLLNSYGPQYTPDPQAAINYQTYVSNGGSLSAGDWGALGGPTDDVASPLTLPVVPGAPTLVPNVQNPGIPLAPVVGDDGLPAAPLVLPDMYTNPATQFNYLNYLANGGQRSLVDFVGAGQPSADEEILGAQAAPSVNIPYLNGPNVTQSPIPVSSIEAQFQANSLRLANEGDALFAQGVADKSIPLNPNIPYNTQAGSFVDSYVRDGNQILSDQLGLDANTVRINQRLYAPDGSYSIPDLYFPQSGNIIDYSYQLKTIETPQIQQFLNASPNARITIVPPSTIRPVYNIGP